MAATLEIKYFNSFWLKKMKTITDVVPSSTSVYDASSSGTSFVIQTALNATKMNVGQKVTFTYNTPSVAYIGYIVSRTNDTSFVVNVAPDTFNPTSQTPTITFGKITNFSRIPGAYAVNTALDWYEEEARVRGGYNNTIVDLGVKAYTTEDNPNQRHRFNSLIYSGIFNPRTGTNNTNQFSVGEDITRSVDPAYASIQKLYAEDTNLIIFQEQKVSRALIDKDAIYSAEGNPISTSSNVVIGQIVAYAGEYGISTDPFSFSVYGYRKYFTDRKRNAVLRLSQDGITEISSYGMHDFFRDSLSVSGDIKIVSAWDMHTKNYILSIQNTTTTSSSSSGDAPASTIPQVMLYAEKVSGCIWASSAGKCPVPPTVPVDQTFFTNLFTWDPTLENTPAASTAQVVVQPGQSYNVGDLEISNNYITLSCSIEIQDSPYISEWRLVRFTYTSNATTGHIENYTYENTYTYPANADFNIQVRGMGSVSDTELVAVMKNTTLDLYQLVKITIPPSGTEVILDSLFDIQGDLSDGTGDIVVTFKADGTTPNKVMIGGYSNQPDNANFNRIWQYDYETGVLEVVSTDQRIASYASGVPGLALVDGLLYASASPDVTGTIGPIVNVSLASPYNWIPVPMAKWPQNFGTHFNNLQGGTGYVTASNVTTTVSPNNGDGLLVDIVAISGVITELTIVKVRDRDISNSSYSAGDLVTITGGNNDATITLTAVSYNQLAAGAASTPASRISDGLDGFPSQVTTTTSVNNETVSFDEDVLGWTSRFDYYPDYIESLGANYYSFKSGQLFQHHIINPTFRNTYANFYGTTYPSSVQLVLNGQPSLIKTFKTINYEGGTEWKMSALTASLISSGVLPTTGGSDDINGQISSTLTRSLPINKYVQATSLQTLQGQLFENNFKRKENKYFGNLVNNTAAMAGEVFFGQETAGVKGFFATVTMTLENSTLNAAGVIEGIGKKELFAITTEYVDSSY
tara:strand:+ start:4134 stop:7052 length:2919 start_codon:yes stop_codon:yes gene_type:complete